MYHPEFLLAGKEDAANSYSRGHYTVGKEMMDKVNDRLRKLVDNCDNVQGFIMNHSVGGGTGSGLGALILYDLSNYYRKKSKVCLCLPVFWLRNLDPIRDVSSKSDRIRGVPVAEDLDVRGGALQCALRHALVDGPHRGLGGTRQ